MSDQDDWEFAGAEDAKAEIRAAVDICCEVLPGAPAVISRRRSFRPCAKLLPGCRPSSRFLWMMVCLADSWGGPQTQTMQAGGLSCALPPPRAPRSGST
jgi:hypothetical protein